MCGQGWHEWGTSLGAQLKAGNQRRKCTFKLSAYLKKKCPIDSVPERAEDLLRTNVPQYISARKEVQTFFVLNKAGRDNLSCRAECPDDHVCYPVGDGCIFFITVNLREDLVENSKKSVFKHTRPRWTYDTETTVSLTLEIEIHHKLLCSLNHSYPYR